MFWKFFLHALCAFLLYTVFAVVMLTCKLVFNHVHIVQSTWNLSRFFLSKEITVWIVSNVFTLMLPRWLLTMSLSAKTHPVDLRQQNTWARSSSGTPGCLALSWISCPCSSTAAASCFLDRCVCTWSMLLKMYRPPRHTASQPMWHISPLVFTSPKVSTSSMTHTATNVYYKLNVKNEDHTTETGTSCSQPDTLVLPHLLNLCYCSGANQCSSPFEQYFSISSGVQCLRFTCRFLSTARKKVRRKLLLSASVCRWLFALRHYHKLFMTRRTAQHNLQDSSTVRI